MGILFVRNGHAILEGFIADSMAKSAFERLAKAISCSWAMMGEQVHQENEIFPQTLGHAVPGNGKCAPDKRCWDDSLH